MNFLNLVLAFYRDFILHKNPSPGIKNLLCLTWIKNLQLIPRIRTQIFSKIPISGNKKPQSQKIS